MAIMLLWPDNLPTVVCAIIYYNYVYVAEAAEINRGFMVMTTMMMIMILIEMD